jgi:hypothetical protein
MAGTTSLLIGSSRDFPDSTVTIDGNAETVEASAGSLYLVHPTAALSLLAQLLAAMTSAGVSAPAVALLESRKVRVSASGTFTVTWTDTLPRDLLGFTGNLSGAATYTAENISPLLWAPGLTETPSAGVLGLLGSKHQDASSAVAPDGTQVVSRFGTQRLNSFSWRYVAKARHQTASELGGEWHTFYDQVLVRGAKFLLYREVIDDEASSTPLSLGTPLGPMEMDIGKAANWPGFRRESGFETVESHYGVDFPALGVPEYTG